MTDHSDILGKTFRHKKRGTLYEAHGIATLQIEGPIDMTECVIYQDLESGRMWVRPLSEFMDGRFEEACHD